ncbi:proline-rich receptor-like protein kinase PERK9 [Cynara cardunculus var. scolymus]|uniref:proline-rich receptor-like protein kinase PERK9 n=1 Tax=Cynara cardunculus var. scolymus TaxID=59895 RepID=UPI000D6304C2|nr:proline-rich receptor-like protein kinase PERK9 [Cynara cardunculus var. scolymus]
MARMKRPTVRNPPPSHAVAQPPAQPPSPPPVTTAAAAVRTPVFSRRQPARRGKRVPVTKKLKGDTSTLLIDEDSSSPLPSPSSALPPTPATVAVDPILPEAPIIVPPLQMVPSDAIIPFTDPLKRIREMVRSSTVPTSKDTPTPSLTTTNNETLKTSQKVLSSSDSTPPEGLFTSDSEEEEDPASMAGEIFMESEHAVLPISRSLKNRGHLCF